MEEHAIESDVHAPYLLKRGNGPLVVSMPHVGVELPPDISLQLTTAGRVLSDTDWYVDRLYDFVSELDASVLQASYSRYVIDLNRPPDNASLYAGMTQTGLCPTLTFDGELIYRTGAQSLSASAIERRLQHYWRPYHAALKELIDKVRLRHGFAVLLDAHSIRSRVPRLFEGRLPHVNVGTDDGRSCSAVLRSTLVDVLSNQQAFTYVFDGRFKGGYITRHYGQPADNIHALQIELAQAGYMDETACAYDTERAKPMRELLRRLLHEITKFSPPTSAELARTS